MTSVCTKRLSGPLMAGGEACCNQLRSQVAISRVSEPDVADARRAVGRAGRRRANEQLLHQAATWDVTQDILDATAASRGMVLYGEIRGDVTLRSQAEGWREVNSDTDKRLCVGGICSCRVCERLFESSSLHLPGKEKKNTKEEGG